MPPRLKTFRLFTVRTRPVVQNCRRYLSTTEPLLLNSSASSPSSSPSNPSSSINPNEISHFSALASSWWDPHGPSRLLHLMNPLRHDFISSCVCNSTATPATTSLGNNKKQLRYLDVGCGGGIFAESAARLPTTAQVTALDPSTAVLKVAQAHAAQDPLLHASQQEGHLRYLPIGVEELPVPERKEELYDVLALWEVLEHVDQPSAFLENCLPFVKPGGWLVLSTIARTWSSWVVTKVVAEDLLKLVPRDTHDWAKYVNEEELRAWFQRRKGWGGDGGMRAMGCVFVPGFGWRFVEGGEKWGNYFFGVRRDFEKEEDL